MRPTLKQFQYLVAIAELGNFKEASKRMNVSQPSLSAQLQDMELELGAKLVERGRKSSILTPTGEEVVRRARVILHSVESLKANTHRRKGAISGRIRLGVLPSIGPYLLPEITGRLHLLYPDLRINIFDQRTTVLDGLLNEGKIDVLISTAEDHSNTICKKLFDEYLWICVAADSPLAHTRAPVKVDELKGHQLLSIGTGNQISKSILDLARISGAFVNTEYEGNGLDATRIMAAMGSGVAVLPSLYALLEARRDPELCLRRVDDHRVKRTISLIWRDSSPISEDFEALAKVISELANEIIVRASQAVLQSQQ